jgi:hypothetical protein
MYEAYNIKEMASPPEFEGVGELTPKQRTAAIRKAKRMLKSLVKGTFMTMKEGNLLMIGVVYDDGYAKLFLVKNGYEEKLYKRAKIRAKAKAREEAPKETEL